MKSKRVYILRHGETNENAKGIVQGSGIDSKLNEKGLRQAEQFFRKYNAIQFDKVIASGLQRSFQTIQKFEKIHPTIVRDQRINEIGWGEHEGRLSDPELMEKYYRITRAWQSGKYNDKPLNGESALELSERLSSFLQDLEKETFRTGLICTHGRTLRAMICMMKNWPLQKMDEIVHSNTGLYVADFYNNSWSVILENDCSHLIREVQY